MSDPIDTGFGDVLAGEVWKAPDDTPVTVPVTTVKDYQPTPHECANATGGTRCDICFGPIGLTPAGVQAAKALIVLPALSFTDLAKLARDVAMDIKDRHVVLKDFNLTHAQYDFLEAHNEFYKNALQAACIEWHAPLSTQKRIAIEAAAILEDSLLGLGTRMQSKHEGLPGVIEAAKFFGKLSGVGERDAGSSGSGERFTINIDLGGDQKITLSTQAPPTEVAAPDRLLPVQPNPEGKS